MKRKRKKKKKRKEAKRKRFIGSNSNSGPSTHRVKALLLSHVEHTERIVEILLLKPLSLIKRDSKIFLRIMTAVSIVKPKVNAFHRIYM